MSFKLNKFALIRFPTKLGSCIHQGSVIDNRYRIAIMASSLLSLRALFVSFFYIIKIIIRLIYRYPWNNLETIRLFPIFFNFYSRGICTPESRKCLLDFKSFNPGEDNLKIGQNLDSFWCLAWWVSPGALHVVLPFNLSRCFD